MTRFIERRGLVLLGLGLALGAILLLARDGASNGSARTVIVSAAQVDSTRTALRQALGREPASAELRSAVDGWVRDEILYREAILRDLEGEAVGDREALVQRMELAALALHYPTAPQEDELRAYHALRVERYGADFAAARPAVQDDMALEAAAAAADRYFHEIAERYRIVYPPTLGRAGRAEGV